MRNGNHHSEHLQRSWNKYGEENFVFEILEELHGIDIKEQYSKEQTYIDHYKSYDCSYGYNIQRNANGGGAVGIMANRSKLTYEQVEEIKIRVILNGDNPNLISPEYNVSTDTIRRMLNGSTYKDIRPDLTREKDVRIQYRNGAIFDIIDNSKKIIDMYLEGISINNIVNMGFSSTTVRRNIDKYNSNKLKEMEEN